MTEDMPPVVITPPESEKKVRFSSVVEVVYYTQLGQVEGVRYSRLTSTGNSQCAPQEDQKSEPAVPVLLRMPVERSDIASARSSARSSAAGRWLKRFFNKTDNAE